MDATRYQSLQQQLAKLQQEQALIAERCTQHTAAYQEKEQECRQTFGVGLEELAAHVQKLQAQVAQDSQQLTSMTAKLETYLVGTR